MRSNTSISETVGACICTAAIIKTHSSVSDSLQCIPTVAGTTLMRLPLLIENKTGGDLIVGHEQHPPGHLVVIYEYK